MILSDKQIAKLAEEEQMIKETARDTLMGLVVGYALTSTLKVSGRTSDSASNIDNAFMALL